MPSYLTSIVLEWSADPLSDSTPTWTTVSNSEIRSIEWWAGIDREGNDPEPGGMRVTLKNVARKWEPLFDSNLIDTQQRFRLTLNGTQEGVWYTETFDIDYPTGRNYSEVTIGCGDGISVLALDDLPSLDPPEAESYEDVVNFDEPWGYWRLGEPNGTRAVANFRRVFKGKGKRRRKARVRSGTRWLAASEAGGVSGPAGTYKNLSMLSLGQPGAITGDRDTSMSSTAVGTTGAYVQIPVDDVSALNASNELTVECWVNPEGTGNQCAVAGPNHSSGNAIWVLTFDPGTPGTVTFRVWDTVSAGYLSHVWNGWTVVGTWEHISAVVSGSEYAIYRNGELVGSRSNLDVAIPNAAASTSIKIGFWDQATDVPLDSGIDEVAVYEHAVSEERLLAHYQAGFERGYGQQTAGERIAAIADSALWSEASIQTTGRDVLPIMHHGQPRLEEIAEAVHAEGPRTMFFFNGAGDPVYLGFEWQETSANYNTVQWTFTDDGTGKPYQDGRPEYDFETFNEVVASHESGESVLVTDAAESDKRRRRVNSEYTDVLLVEHHDVEALAAGVLDYYKKPAKRFPTLTIDGHHCLAQILDLDIGHLIKVTKQGETGAATERVCHIIAKRKAIDTSKHLVCTYTLSRGFDPTDGFWHLGYDGYSELGETTVIA